MDVYDELYGVGLLDDLHNFFPAVLYQPQQFRTVQDLLQYISRQTQTQFNLFDRGLRRFEQTRSTIASTPPLQRAAVNTAAQAQASAHTRLQSAVNNAPRTIHTSLSPQLDIITETFDITPFLTGTGAAATTGLTAFNGINDLITLLRGEIPMEPVRVVPTQQQINTATHVFESLRNEHADAICSICQEGYSENILIRQIRHCNHMFHRQCIDQWFQQNVHCPVCRFDIRNHTTTTNAANYTSTISESHHSYFS
jgi:hypothetical protein